MKPSVIKYVQSLLIALSSRTEHA